jgi:hypothetical protein
VILVIYDYPAESDPIRQGDIFFGLPRIDVPPKDLTVVEESGLPVERTWSEIAMSGEPTSIVVGVRPVIAIVASQDCDAVRAPDITLCEIRPFQDVERKSRETTSPKKWKNILTQQSRVNQKWFYLPPDARVGFTLKMGADFQVVLRLRRVQLEDLRSFRHARLNDIAEAHFRERIAEFFRRYAYDEWYCLDAAELAAYVEENPETTPYPWQTNPASPQS